MQCPKCGEKFILDGGRFVYFDITWGTDFTLKFDSQIKLFYWLIPIKIDEVFEVFLKGQVQYCFTCNFNKLDVSESYLRKK